MPSSTLAKTKLPAINRRYLSTVITDLLLCLPFVDGQDARISGIAEFNQRPPTRVTMARRLSGPPWLEGSMCASRFLQLPGCGTIRIYGLGAFQASGYLVLASSSDTALAMM